MSQSIVDSFHDSGQAMNNISLLGNRKTQGRLRGGGRRGRVSALVASLMMAAAFVAAAPPGRVSAATVDRVAGTDRYATSVEIARQVGGGSLTNLDRLIVVTGEVFPDGLTASGLAGFLDEGGRSGRTAILLTRQASLPPIVEVAIRESRVSPEKVFVVGGPSAVSDDVYGAIARAAGWNGQGDNPVTRIFGQTRYETAAAIVEFVTQQAGGTLPASFKTVLVANGEDFPDALAGGALAYRSEHLLLLAQPPSAPPVSLDAVEELEANCAILLGGNAALSNVVNSQVDAELSGQGCGTNRVGGADRFATAALIANRMRAANGNPTRAVLASGTNFADALVAAPLAANNTPVLFTSPNGLPAATLAWLQANSGSLSNLQILGGTNAIPQSVVNAAVAAIGGSGGSGGGGSSGGGGGDGGGDGGTWPAQAGGPENDAGYSISALADGTGAIVTGEFSGEVDFVTTTGTTTLDSGSPSDSALFVGKVDTAGNWVWAVSAGGNGAGGAGVVALSDGSAIVTGHFFDRVTLSAVNTVSGSAITFDEGPNQLLNDILVAKVSASGKWEWAVNAGGAGSDFGHSIALAGDSVIVTGSDTGQLFVAKFATTSALAWATTSAGVGDNSGYAVSALADGSAIVSGNVDGTIDFGDGINLSASNGAAFVAKISADGTSWQWAAKVDGSGYDAGQGVSVLSDGSAIVTGQFEGLATFTPTASASIELTALDNEYAVDAFVAKINGSGEWVWAAQVSGTNEAIGNAVVTSSGDSAIVTGQVRSAGNGTFTSAEGGSGPITLTVANRDLFVAKIDPSGNWLWASGAGGSNSEAEGSGVAVLSTGHILVAGSFEGTIAVGSTSISSDDDSEDVFVARLSSTGAFG